MTTEQAIKKFNDEIDQELNKIISFMMFHNLKSKIKFESIQAKYLNYDGRMIETPLVMCDALVSQIETEDTKPNNSITELENKITMPEIQVPNVVVYEEDLQIEEEPEPGDIDFEPEPNPVPVPSSEMTKKEPCPVAEGVNKLRGANHPDNNKSIRTRINDVLESLKFSTK